MHVPCVGCVPRVDSNKRALPNKHAMGARRAELKGRKKCFLRESARPSPNPNKRALPNKRAMGALQRRKPISVIARLKKKRVEMF